MIAYGDLTSRINKHGDLFFLRGGKGPNEFVISHQQIELLKAMFQAEGRQLARTRIGYTLFPDRPLTNSQRASVSRMVRRLVGLNILQADGQKIAFTSDGEDFTDYILNEYKYDDMMAYMKGTRKR
jgi:hypothetical protein